VGTWACRYGCVYAAQELLLQGHRRDALQQEQTQANECLIHQCFLVQEFFWVVFSDPFEL